MNWLVDPFKKYIEFSGRASRKQYWMFMLFVVVIAMILGFFDGLMGTQIGETPQSVGVLSLIWSLAILLPSLSITVRRLHDTNRSGWWFLISFIPLLGGVVLVVFMVMNGNAGSNQYGLDPKLSN